MKKIVIILLIILCAFSITGCDEEYQDLAYNVLISNAVVDKLDEEFIGRGNTIEYAYLNADNKIEKYVISTDDYDNLIKIQQLYIVSEPNKQLKIDAIYNSSLKRIVSIAIHKEDKKNGDE